MGSGTVTAITPRIIIEECVRRGINRKDLLDTVGISSDFLYQAAGRVPIEKMHVLWDHVLLLSPDQMVGVFAAESAPFGAYGILDYMLVASSSPREALERSSRSFALVNSAFMLSLRMHCDLAYLELHNPGSPRDLPRPYIEYILVNYLMRLRLATQMNYSPLEVHVTYKNPGPAETYDRVFGAPFRFSQPMNRLVFPRSLMDICHPQADPELCELLEGYAQRKLQHSSHKKPLAEIYDVIAHNLESGSVTLTFISRQLASSSRSLQRELYANGTTFREILDRIRHERALALLADPDLPITEIALKLQFSDATAFCRAFQRWEGRSPHQYRRHFNQH